MFKLKLFVVAVALTSMMCSAQQDKTEIQAPVFTSGIGFVQVPVIVQKSGKHVSGLKKEDFVLRQDGKEQPIASFEEMHRSVNPTSSAQPKSDFGNEATHVLPQITIIAIDMVNTPNLDRAYFEEEFKRYLSRSSSFPGPIGLVEIERGGIRVVKGFTTDPRVLLASFTKDATSQPTANNDASLITRQVSDEAIANSEIYGGPIGSELRLREADEAMVRFQDRSSRLDTLYAIQQLAQGLKGIPGRKTLLLVGSGFKFIDSKVVLRSISGGWGGTELNYSVENGGQTFNQTLYTWKLLNDANVAVYPIDTRRTVNTAFQTMDTSSANTPSDLSFEQNRQADRDVLDSFKTIAAATGGKPCFYRTDLDNCVREAVDDDHDYYLLGFYADKKNRQPGWHKIEVKLDEKANVRYRQGFIIANFNSDAARKSDIGLALNSPFAYTDLPFTGSFDPPGANNRGAKFNLAMPPGAILPDESNGHLDFDVVAIARSAGGKEAARVVQHVDRKVSPQNVAEIKKIGIDYSNRLDIPSGEYGVWFVVRDNITGRTGSAVVPLKVP
jgi:VWFA-related protein